MLSTKKITLEAKTAIDGKEIMGFRAIFTPGSNDGMTFLPYQIDKDACKEHRDTVRDDQREFEDYAYQLQDEIAEAAKGDK